MEAVIYVPAVGAENLGSGPGDQHLSRAIDRPLDALAKLMPDIDAADSVTGNLFLKTSQFIAGFLGAGKFIKAKGVVGATTTATSRAARLARPAGAGGDTASPR